MIFLYNILQLLLSPLLFLFLILSSNRPQNLLRLGLGFHCRPKQIGRKTFWFHADSASEISSSRLLIKGVKQIYPDTEIFLSTINTENVNTARNILDGVADHIIISPLDIRFVVNRFLRLIEPDLFILVNSRLQFHLPGCCLAKKTPFILVNFRISTQQNTVYNRFDFVFKPLFANVDKICVQTNNDRQKLIQLGVNQNILHTLGNLTFDTALYAAVQRKRTISFSLPKNKLLLVAGATHEEEEEIILQCFQKLQTAFPGIYLIIVPYKSERGAAIHSMAKSMGLTANRRSQINAGGKDLFIIDSPGELNRAYSLADIAFVGGSMVAGGGHNPIEPAIYGIPVLFGHHMENYFDITGELMQAGAGIMVRDQIELLSNLEALLKNGEWRKKKGAAARDYCQSKQGVIAKHLSVIQEAL